MSKRRLYIKPIAIGDQSVEVQGTRRNREETQKNPGLYEVKLVYQLLPRCS